MSSEKQNSSMKPFMIMNTDTSDELAPNLVGAVIGRVRRMTPAKLAANYWYSDSGVVVLELTDGTLLYPSQDEEGNGPGILFGETPDGRPFRVYVDEAPGE